MPDQTIDLLVDLALVPAILVMALFYNLAIRRYDEATELDMRTKETSALAIGALFGSITWLGTILALTLLKSL